MRPNRTKRNERRSSIVAQLNNMKGNNPMKKITNSTSKNPLRLPYLVLVAITVMVLPFALSSVDAQGIEITVPFQAQFTTHFKDQVEGTLLHVEVNGRGY